MIEGLAIGACYGLFGMAVVIIYKTSEVVNFAQGEMAMFATFVAFHILTLYHWPFWAAFHRHHGLFHPARDPDRILFLRPAKHPSILGLIVITLGAEMLLMGLGRLEMGGRAEILFPALRSVTYEPIKGMIFNNWAIAVFAVTACIMVFLYLFFKYSKLGVAMRATQQNNHAAKIMGISTERVFSIAWGFSSLSAPLRGCFLLAGSLDPDFMMEPFMRAFAAAVLGGLMSIPGVIIGGGLMGIIENFFGYFLPQWKPIVAFIVIILVLCLRPSGLFAKHFVKKV